MIRPLRTLLLFFGIVFFYVVLIRLRPDYAPQIPSFQDPSRTGKDWPNKIWQTWKAPATSISDEDHERVKTWHDLNPTYRYELLTDGSAEAFVHQHFDEEPLIKDTYFALTDNILRADFLRYLILLGEGGVRLPHPHDTNGSFSCRYTDDARTDSVEPYLGLHRLRHLLPSPHIRLGPPNHNIL